MKTESRALARRSHSSRLRFLVPAILLVLGLCLAPGLGLAAQEANSSLSDLQIEFSEAKLTLASAAQENLELREQLKTAQGAVSSLTESLAVANSEAEVFRRESRELKLRLEALGLDGASADRSKLEQRLLKAVRDYQLLQADKDGLADELVRMTEATLRYVKTADSKDSEARMAVETEMRNTNKLLGVGPATEATQEPASLMDSRVISVKDELALVVANVGSLHGVKVGMPFQVWRSGDEIGTVRVVDVRDRFSGAIIQNLIGDKQKIEVGDRLRVDAKQF